MKNTQNGKVRKMDLKRLRDLFSHYQKAERMFEQFKTFCQGAYGQKIVDTLLVANGQQSIERIMLKSEREGISADQVILRIINKIEKPVFSSQEVIQMCNELGHQYNMGTIYRTLNKLGREERLSKIRTTRNGKRAVDWKKNQPVLPLKERTNEIV